MNLTTGILIGTAFVLVLYDLLAITLGGYQDTISWVVYQAAKRHPIIPFALGILCGHLFWTQLG